MYSCPTYSRWWSRFNPTTHANTNSHFFSVSLNPLGSWGCHLDFCDPAVLSKNCVKNVWHQEGGNTREFRRFKSFNMKRLHLAVRPAEYANTKSHTHMQSRCWELKGGGCKIPRIKHENFRNTWTIAGTWFFNLKPILYPQSQKFKHDESHFLRKSNSNNCSGVKFLSAEKTENGVALTDNADLRTDANGSFASLFTSLLNFDWDLDSSN